MNDESNARPEDMAAWGIWSRYTDGLGRDITVSPQVLAKVRDAVVPQDAGEHNLVPSPIPAVAPEQTYQGPPGEALRTWVIAVQLYGVRSRSNWGHGDFTDLATLLECAAGCGAGGIGLNPLHILFDDRPGHISPYSPNSRMFLDPLYIDVEQIAEFPGVAALHLQSEVARLRACELVDYHGVRTAKQKALRACHAAFRESADAARRQDFDAYRAKCGRALRRFACFETLRPRFKEPWWLWPDPWRAPSDADLASLSAASAEAVEFHEYVQWIADRQLAACRATAQRLGLPVGLYIDLAVGVVPDGSDAWSNQTTMLRGVTIGAPPDRINMHGQNWGLTTFSPAGLAANGFEPYRLMLSAAMSHADAIRIDHVLGLNRLFVIPDGMSGADGTYLDFPIEALLAVTAEQSQRHRCVVIGEDLGTVPEDLRGRLNRWGLWTYLVMQFERDWEGRFHPPQNYPEKALVTFATHDLPTFAGWWAGRDLTVRHRIGIDPGETVEDRERARGALRDALSGAGLSNDGGHVAIVHYLAATRSRIVSVPLEDVLGSFDQPNLPGTVDQYPNWRMRSAAMAEDLASNEQLQKIAAAMRAAGRAIKPG